MADSPTGTVTFLFTDIEGSTRMWEQDPQAMSDALARHDDILQNATQSRGGHVFKTVGDAFSDASDALEAALASQRSLSAEEWEEGFAIRARMALHTGSVEERGGDYFGPPVNRVARLLSAGHGGQTLLSSVTRELVRDTLPEGTELRDLGERRLKDLFRPERIFQLAAPGLPSEFPALRTLEGHPNNLPLQPTPLVGREREVAEIADRARREEAHLLTLFRDLHSEQLSKLAARLHQKTFPPRRQRHHTAEERRDSVYVILEGTAKVYVTHTDGTEVILAILGPGEIVGEMRSHWHVVLADNAGVLGRSAFLEMVHRRPRAVSVDRR